MKKFLVVALCYLLLITGLSGMALATEETITVYLQNPLTEEGYFTPTEGYLLDAKLSTTDIDDASIEVDGNLIIVSLNIDSKKLAKGLGISVRGQDPFFSVIKRVDSDYDRKVTFITEDDTIRFLRVSSISTDDSTFNTQYNTTNVSSLNQPFYFCSDEGVKKIMFSTPDKQFIFDGYDGGVGEYTTTEVRHYDPATEKYLPVEGEEYIALFEEVQDAVTELRALYAEQTATE